MIVTAILRYKDYDPKKLYMDSLYLTFTGYLLIFSYVFCMAECEYEPILKSLGFLKSYTGKGLFLMTIGIFLFDFRRIYDVISGIVLVVLGFFDIVYDCGRNNDEKKK